VKAAALAAAVLLVIAHPAVVIAVVAAELGVLGVVAAVILRGRRTRPGRHRRTA
jgi:hypothetical protein